MLLLYRLNDGDDQVVGCRSGRAGDYHKWKTHVLIPLVCPNPSYGTLFIRIISLLRLHPLWIIQPMQLEVVRPKHLQVVRTLIHFIFWLS